MKILVIFTGGTIGSSKNEEGFYSTDQKKAYRLLSLYQERYSSQVAFESVEPYRILSEQMDEEHLSRLCACVQSHLKEGYDGIIVTHGTDSLCYSAAALGYCLGKDTIPVVLVSSNYILEDNRMNGLANFAAAVQLITDTSERGVFVAYQNTGGPMELHRATRLLRHEAYSDDVRSLHGASYGWFFENRFVRNPNVVEREDTEVEFGGTFGKVLWMMAAPFLAYDQIDLSDIGAILLEGYHSGTLPTEHRTYISLLERARAMQIPIFLVGAMEESVYESKKVFYRLQISPLPELAPIAAYMKLSMLLPIAKNNEELLEMMSAPRGGDLVKYL